MSNISIEMLKQEVLTAKKQALLDPYRYERTTEGLAEKGQLRDNSGKITFPAAVREKVVQIFDKFPDQLKILGLYYDAGFTAEEIAEIQHSQEDSVTRSLRRAKARLKKYLTTEEYYSISRFIGDHKPKVEATQAPHVNPFYNDFVAQYPVRTGNLREDNYIEWADGKWLDTLLPTPIQREINGIHPPDKNLPLGSMYYETGFANCSH